MHPENLEVSFQPVLQNSFDVFLTVGFSDFMESNLEKIDVFLIKLQVSKTWKLNSWGIASYFDLDQEFSIYFSEDKKPFFHKI